MMIRAKAVGSLSVPVNIEHTYHLSNTLTLAIFARTELGISTKENGLSYIVNGSFQEASYELQDGDVLTVVKMCGGG